MNSGFSISLKNRLALTYAAAVSLMLIAITLLVNLFTGIIFNSLVKNNITAKSREIALTIGDFYNPGRMRFDTAAIDTMGMYFVQEGYIVRVEDPAGRMVWDARSRNMMECMHVMNGIANRMESRFRSPGGTQVEYYPLSYGNRPIGTVSIETYGPIFYSETETDFLNSINRIILISGIVLVVLNIVISGLLSSAIAKPILQSANAARQLADIYSRQGLKRANEVIRIPDQYNTRELAELSQSINILARKLEEGERRQMQLTGDVAHELRTPLACLQGNIEAMIDGVYAPDRENLESCHEEVVRLTRLIEDLNTLAGFEWNNIALNKTEFDLGKLLQAAAGQWENAAREKGIELELNVCEAPIFADYDRLKQVFVNLLSNAVKYTDKGSIRAGIEKKHPSGYKITFADTGIGIPEDEIPHIFERLYRSDKSRSRRTGGAGIGLAIAAAIISAHGGTIRAESKCANSNAESGGSSTGSIFHVQL